MALPWEIISENVLNISKVLNDLMDTVDEKDVEWVQKDENGNISTVNIPNLSKIAKLLGRKYIGADDNEPTSKIDGSELEPGDLYFDTNKNQMMVYNGSEWKSVAFASTLLKAEFTGDGATTEFTVNGGYNPNMGMVFLNGVNVNNVVDISSGSVIKFKEPPAEGDIIEAYFYNSFKVADTYTKIEMNNILKKYKKEILVSTDMEDNFEAEAYNKYYVNTSEKEITVTLPSNPLRGEEIMIFDPYGNFETNNCIIDGNGNNIMGESMFYLNMNNKLYTIEFNGIEWRVR